MIGAGFIGGRFTAPEPLDTQELRAALESSLKSSLEPAIRQESRLSRRATPRLKMSLPGRFAAT
jgi:hypothetical protein